MPAMNELVNEHHFVARCTHTFPLDHKVMKDIRCAYRPQFLGAIGVGIVAPARFPAATGTLHYLRRIVGVTKDNRITLWAMDLAIHGMLYPQGHPYSRPSIGTRETVEALTAAEMRAFHDAFYTPHNLTVSIAGALDRDLVRSKLERWLPNRPAGGGK